MMIKDKKVGELVTENINTAHVFKKHGIDFCCGGGISISKACEVNDVDEEDLIADLLAVDHKPSPSMNYDAWSTDFLVQHIENVHHTYVREAIPMIQEYATKVAQVHGHAYPEVKKIYFLFQGLASDLSQHLLKEEQVLFPATRELLKNPEAGSTMIMHPVAIMEKEHEVAGDMLREIRQLTNDFTPPEGACNTFRALYAKLEEFENDLHLHVHLENNVLFNRLRNL